MPVDSVTSDRTGGTGPRLAVLDDHNRFRELLDRFEAALPRVGLDDGLDAVEELARFLSLELPRHEKNEERAVFPVIALRMADDPGPLRRLATEHAHTRLLAARFAAAAADWSEGVPGAAVKLVRVAESVVAQLRAHIAQEEAFLEQLGPEEREQIARRWGGAP